MATTTKVLNQTFSRRQAARLSAAALAAAALPGAINPAEASGLPLEQARLLTSSWTETVEATILAWVGIHSAYGTVSPVDLQDVYEIPGDPEASAALRTLKRDLAHTIARVAALTRQGGTDAAALTRAIAHINGQPAVRERNQQISAELAVRKARYRGTAG
jgi:hypothetical protein